MGTLILSYTMNYTVNLKKVEEYIIEKCRFLITTRIHVAVAGYSSCVPTVVTGYKMKSTGIARDIFGCEENYIKSIQSLRKDTDFEEAFKWIMDNEYRIKEYLKIKFQNMKKERSY